jgi:hypothetical protein
MGIRLVPRAAVAFPTHAEHGERTGSCANCRPRSYRTRSQFVKAFAGGTVRLEAGLDNDMTAAWQSLPLQRQEVSDFVALFSRFEYALKRAGFMKDKPYANANWDEFAACPDYECVDNEAAIEGIRRAAFQSPDSCQREPPEDWQRPLHLTWRCAGCRSWTMNGAHLRRRCNFCGTPRSA